MTNVLSALIQIQLNTPFILSRGKGILFQNFKVVARWSNAKFSSKQLLRL